MQNGTITSLSGGNHAPVFDTLSGTFKRIWQREGVLGLFKGNGTNIIRIVPYSSMQFASYELLLKVPSVANASRILPRICRCR